MINGAILGTDVILTGFLEEALEEFAEMVIIETSSKETKGTTVFSNRIYLLSTRRWTPDFKRWQPVGRTVHRWQPSPQPENKSANRRFFFTVINGVAISFTETTNESSSIAFTPCLGIGAVTTLGLSGASNSISLASYIVVTYKL